MWYIIMSCFETLVSPIFFTYPIGLRAPGRTVVDDFVLACR